MQPSSKTNFVVLGEDAGPSKLAAIKKHGLKTIDEDGLLNLIRTRDGVLDQKTLKKMKEEEENVKKEVLDAVEVVQKHIESLEEEMEPQQAEMRKKRKRVEEQAERAEAEQRERDAKRRGLIEGAENFVKRSVTRVVKSLPSLRRKRVVDVYLH